MAASSTWRIAWRSLWRNVRRTGLALAAISLSVALVLAYIALSSLDLVRARLLTRANIRLDQRVAPKLLAAMIGRSGEPGGARSQALRDFDSVRQFVTGAGIHAIFDLPWAPIYIAVMFMFFSLRDEREYLFLCCRALSSWSLRWGCAAAWANNCAK